MSDRRARLSQAFFDRDCLTVARDLLGRYLRHGRVVLQITEVEAYRGPHDSAAHSRVGRTARTAPTFGPPGHAYVYLCYGIHHLLNLVARPEGAAVLIRACAPVQGLDLVQARRGGRDGPALLSGPGKVGQALAIDTGFSHHPVFRADGLEALEGVPARRILVGPRVGIDYASADDRAAPWRLAMADTGWVSHRKTLRADG